MLVPIREHGSKPPLFLVHGLHGNVLEFLWIPAPYAGRPATVWRSGDGLDSGRAAFVSIPDMAENYIKEMRSVQPGGPYFLGGFSAGGLVAYEMARQLVEAGERVQFLALFDSYVEAAGGYWLKSFYSRRALRMSLLRAPCQPSERAKGWAALRVQGKIAQYGHQSPHHAVAAAGQDVRKRKAPLSSTQPHFLSPREAFTHAIRVYAPQPYAGVGDFVSQSRLRL